MGSSSGGVPPGFRFHPTDEELLHYYLKKKVSFQNFDMEVIREVDLNRVEPWEFQERCRIGSTPQNEWYIFSRKDRKYPTGSRTNRATSAGFWKATGRDKCIRNSYKKIGMRKTLVFYRGRAPRGQKTDWIMHEYRLEEDSGDDPQGTSSSEDGWVVCRVFKKKNLFRVGNGAGLSTASMNSSDHQQQQQQQLQLNPSSTSQTRSYGNHYLMCNHQQQPYELNKPELALHYPQMANPHHYSLYQSQQSLLPKPLGYDYSSSGLGPPDHSPVMVKQLMSNARDCESGSESLRYHQACEPGLEVGTCDQATQQMVVGGRSDDNGLNEWDMLERIVTSQIGNEDASSKGVRFEDGNASSVHPINQLSLRGEMDFWGYAK